MKLSFVHIVDRYTPPLEIIERKGVGHPDTLSDDLAERLSQAYSRHTIDRFGAVLHHNFDKVGLLGGRSEVAFGRGVLTSPIRVLLNGRASVACNGESIAVHELLEREARLFLGERFPLLDKESDFVIHNNLSTAGSPGYVEVGRDSGGARKRWFAPNNVGDLREAKFLQSNDTSVGCAHYPLSGAEKCVLELENRLTSSHYRKARPWLGTDVKVMACRVGDDIDITMCVPQIANHVPNLASYRRNLEESKTDLIDWANEIVGSELRVQLWVNTKDNFDIPELYLTAIGSSLETGDEGLVGRGNRPNRLIAMRRPYSMEGACGKNPVYHAGKIYNVAAQRIAERLNRLSESYVEVWVIGQEGRMLHDPWQVVVCHDLKSFPRAAAEVEVNAVMQNMTSCTRDIIDGRVQLC